MTRRSFSIPALATLCAGFLAVAGATARNGEGAAAVPDRVAAQVWGSQYDGCPKDNFYLNGHFQCGPMYGYPGMCFTVPRLQVGPRDGAGVTNDVEYHVELNCGQFNPNCGPAIQLQGCAVPKMP